MGFLETHATELVGYLAMLVLLVSFLMKDIRHLRMLNSVACALFCSLWFYVSNLLANYNFERFNHWNQYLLPVFQEKLVFSQD